MAVPLLVFPLEPLKVDMEIIDMGAIGADRGPVENLTPVEMRLDPLVTHHVSLGQLSIRRPMSALALAKKKKKKKPAAIVLARPVRGPWSSSRPVRCN